MVAEFVATCTHPMTRTASSPPLTNFRKLLDFPAFDAFARALWRDEAAVMVGAGFSRLCEREPDSPTPPLWGDFQAVMGKALGYEPGREPDSLRLAQEYRALHGEDGLDRLIRQMVSDDQWAPGRLHEQLLALPWQDVLTTNWDTLLERTQPRTPDRIYGCVRTMQDIAHVERPRIVKLHGSLPSHRPFIFTEDDFRTYPARFSPFVNLAQQVMLEKELCLIGFSGSDPNFLAWSGWVRDTLTVFARRIRLVGALNLSPSTRSLLEERNITPIDLTPLVEDLPKAEQHGRALEFFFDALQASRTPSPSEWIRTSKKFLADHAGPEEQKAARKEVAAAWRKDREAYPGWISPPYNTVYNLQWTAPTLRKAEEPPEDHLHFAWERIWRHSIAGNWLNPQDIKEADTHYDAAKSGLAAGERIELCAAIAADLRRRQKWDDWVRWMARLEEIGGAEASLHHAYETGLRALLNWDDEGVLKAARNMKSDRPIWMMRRAGLLATLFQHVEAAELYAAALLSIRQKLFKAPKSVWLTSLEAWASLFRHVSNSVLTEGSSAPPERDSDTTRQRYFEAKTDPWDTISRFDKLISDRLNRNREESEQWKLSFRSGEYRRDRTVRSWDYECPFYGLLDLIERTGAPASIASTDVFSARIETALRAVTNPDEDDLMVFLARYRGADKKILDRIMPRMQVARLTDQAVARLLSAIPARIDRLIESKDVGRANNNISFLLELLARLVIRADSERAFALFEWCVRLLRLPQLWWGCYEACGAVLEGAIEALGPEDRRRAIDLALNLQTPGEAGALALEWNWPEPLESFSQDDVLRYGITLQNSLRINTIINIVRSGSKIDRARSLRRLHIFYNAKHLTETQIDTLERAIWTRCGEDGWPSDTDLHPWVFLDLPGKGRAVPLFKKSVIDAVANGEIDEDLLMNLRLGLDRLENTLPKADLVACLRTCLNWQPAPPKRRDPLGFTPSSTNLNRATSREIGTTLATSLLPRLEVEDLPDDLRESLRQLDRLADIPGLVATAFQIARLWPDRVQFSIDVLRSAIASRDPLQLYPAYTAISQFIKVVANRDDFSGEIREVLIHGCEQRTQPGLSLSLRTISQMREAGLLNNAEVERIVRALPVILQEYRYDQPALEVPSRADLPVVRKWVHRLADSLCQAHPQLKEIRDGLAKDPLPEVRDITPEAEGMI